MTVLTSRVLIAGANGALGALLCRAFADRGWEVIGAARHPRDASQRFLDLDTPETIARAVEDVDLIITTVPHPDLTLERYVLRAGGRLVNVSAMPAAARAELIAETHKPRGSVVMDAGIAPGLTNLVAAQLLKGAPEADEIQIVFTVSAKSTSGPAGADFAHRGLTGQRNHDTVRVLLPEPFGARTCIGFAERDGGWLGSSIGNRAVKTYVCFGERGAHSALRAANAVGLLGRVPRRLLGSGGGSAPTDEPVRHHVAVLRDGEMLAARTVRCTGDYIAAAAATAVMAEAMRTEDIGPGVFGPQDIFDLGVLVGALQAAGIEVVAETLHTTRRGQRPLPTAQPIGTQQT
jgi:NAD(P)-dependent dehydrogenase (short-subunit alcohol dehydrogenase family)